MLQKLKELGLTQYEIDTYITLLQHGALTGTKISKISKVPHGKVYWALHRLCEKQLINVVEIKPQIFKVIDPKIGLDHLIKEKMDNLSDLNSSIIKDINQLNKPIRKEKIVEKIQVLSGKKARFSLFYHFCNSAKKDLMYIFTYEERSYTMLRAMKDAVQRGVRVRLIATQLQAPALKLIREDIKNGVEVKYLNVEEMRLQIMDDKEARLTVINPKDRRDRTTIYFQHTNMAKHFADYFDSLWKKAEEI